LSCTGAGGSATQSATVTVTAAPTGTATLSWTPPTTNTDGTPVTTLTGYHVYYGTSQAGLTQSAAISGATTTSYVVTGLAAGTWYFAVAADAADGTESAQSALGSKTL
jgi:Fibronectin type III domain